MTTVLARKKKNRVSYTKIVPLSQDKTDFQEETTEYNIKVQARGTGPPQFQAGPELCVCVCVCVYLLGASSCFSASLPCTPGGCPQSVCVCDCTGLPPTGTQLVPESSSASSGIHWKHTLPISHPEAGRSHSNNDMTKLIYNNIRKLKRQILVSWEGLPDIALAQLLPRWWPYARLIHPLTVTVSFSASPLKAPRLRISGHGEQPQLYLI